MIFSFINVMTSLYFFSMVAIALINIMWPYVNFGGELIDLEPINVTAKEFYLSEPKKSFIITNLFLVMTIGNSKNIAYSNFGIINSRWDWEPVDHGSLALHQEQVPAAVLPPHAQCDNSHSPPLRY